MDEWYALESIELPEDFVLLVKPELMPGERLVWVARSDLVRYKPWAEFLGTLLCCLGMIVISILCFAAFTGTFGMKLQESDTTWAVFGVVFALFGMVGFYVVTVQGLRNVRRGTRTLRTTYALTDRRAIIWRTTYSTDGIEVFSLSRSSVKSVHRVEYPDGGGAVIFRFADVLPYDVPNRFDGIPDVRRVEEYVRQVFGLDPAT